MAIDCVESIDQFERLKSDWESAYLADPHVHIFVSWAWLRGFFEITRYHWFILAYKIDRNSSYTAFLPLTLEERKSPPEKILRLGGTPNADYTGLVCLPGLEDSAIPAFAEYLQKGLTWDRFLLRDTLDPRIEQLLNPFSCEHFSVELIESLSCPYIQLPNSWDQYLANSVGSKTRYNIRYYTKKIEALDSIRVTYLKDSNYDRQIGTALSLWEDRWKNNSADYQSIFRYCYANNNLWSVAFWQNETLIASLACFIDQQKSIFYDFISVFNERYARLRPGRVAIAHAIRYAIEHGFQIFDFLRGAEEYKFALGATERFAFTHQILHKSLRKKVELGAWKISKKLARVIHQSQ